MNAVVAISIDDQGVAEVRVFTPDGPMARTPENVDTIIEALRAVVTELGELKHELTPDVKTPVPAIFRDAFND